MLNFFPSSILCSTQWELATLVRSAVEANGVLSCGQAVGQQALVVQLLSTWGPVMIRLGCGWQISALLSTMKRYIHPSSSLSVQASITSWISTPTSLRDGWGIRRQQWPLTVLHSFMSTVLLCLFADAWHLGNCKPSQSSSCCSLQERLMGSFNVCIKLPMKSGTSVCCGNSA